MSTITAGRMTAEEFLALPEDGMDRELIRGELREKPMTVRNRFHSKCLMEIGRQLGNWTARQPNREFLVVGGEAGFRLPSHDDSVVGIDVAVVRSSVYSEQSDATSIINGIPTLAVEILSPSDTHEAVFEKTQLYLQSGVPLVWIVDPDEHSVKVHRPGRPPEFFPMQQTLSGEPTLPGLVIALADIFELL